MEGLWQTIQSLSLNNQKWLSERLIENIGEKESDKYISKSDVLAGIDAGLKDYKAGRGMLAEDFSKILHGESYN